jgi:hypothetical protein
MIHFIKISLLMVISLLVLVACSDSEQMLTGPNAINQPEGMVQTGLNYLPTGSENVVSRPILAPGNVEAGNLFISNDRQNLYVSYYLFEGWQLSETRIAVAPDAGQLPRDEEGNLLPDRFQFQIPQSRCETVFTHKIPLAEAGLNPGDLFVIASQALVAEVRANDLDRLPNICVPGRVDAEWMFIGQSRVKVDPNAPDQPQKLVLEQLSDREI